MFYPFIKVVIIAILKKSPENNVYSIILTP
jgi:hypothetical protein